MIFTKSENIGILGTILIHLLLVGVLLIFGFEKKESAAEDGLLVNFGNIDEASGLFEPGVETTAIQEKQPVTKSEKEIITQDQETSVALTEKKKEKAEELRKNKEAEQIKLKEKQIQAEQNKKAAAIRNQAASAFGTTAGKGTSQGTASTGTGNQGTLNGDAHSTNTVGSGAGYGHFSLNGRNLNGGLPHPSYAIQEEGIVVIQIVVNSAGIVTTASVALKGTNTDNATLRNAALAAAKQARFNAIGGNQVQSGTITYRFRLK
ncbi:MAG: TonB family protein [Bacteroidales bacterium]|nr:TonB family protein [Bacteroidales bacterium]